MLPPHGGHHLPKSRLRPQVGGQVVQQRGVIWGHYAHTVLQPGLGDRARPLLKVTVSLLGPVYDPKPEGSKVGVRK